MSISSALSALADDVTAARAKITSKGGTVTPNGGTSQLVDDIDTIPSGGITPSGSVTLTEENTYDVTDKAQAVVDMSATRANLAEAVTAKGVDTLPTSSFDTIATNIGLISGGEIPFEIKTGSLVLVSQEPSMNIDSKDTRIPLMAYFEYVGLPSPLVPYRMLAWIFEGMSAETISNKTKRINGNPSVAVNVTTNAVAFNNGVYNLGKWSNSYFFMPGTYRWVIVYEKQ